MPRLMASTVPRKSNPGTKDAATPKKAAPTNGKRAGKPSDNEVLAELRAREAELAMINTVQQGLAARLDMAAMYRLVGDKIGEIIDSQAVGIRLFDVGDGMMSAPYLRERGALIEINETLPIGPLVRELIARRAPLLVSDVPAWEDEHGVKTAVPYGERTKTVMMAPMIAGDELRGYITLQNIDRTNAYSEADLALLATIASSLSLALDNAQLFAETEQRNAELAVINEISDALAKELDFEAIIEAVGERITRIFNVESGSVSLYDPGVGNAFPALWDRSG